MWPVYSSTMCFELMLDVSALQILFYITFPRHSLLLCLLHLEEMCKWHLVPVTVIWPSVGFFLGGGGVWTVNRNTFLCPVCRSLWSRRDSTWQTSMPGAPSSHARPTPTSPGPSDSPAVWHCSWPTWLSMPSGTNDNRRRWEGNTITWKGVGGYFLD